MSSGNAEGVKAVIRRFPARRLAIEGLARQKESFRDICDEFAAAEAALAAVDRLDEAAQAKRRSEWLCFIRGALAEIEAELQRCNVVSIGPGGRRPP